MKKTTKLTYEYVKNFINRLGYKLVDNIYVNTNSRLTLVDNVGFYYYPTFNNLRDGKTPERFHKSNPYTLQNIKLWCILNNKPFQLLSEEYLGCHEKLKWKCLKNECGDIFLISWDCILRDYNCPCCSGRQVGLSNCLATKRPDLAKEWHPTLNDNLTPYDITCKSNKKVWWQCNNNPKHKWESSVANRQKGNGCPHCSHNPPVSEEHNLLVINPELCKEWNYDKNEKRPEEYCPNSNKYVWWKCKECNNEWLSNINNRNKGYGCPRCNESKGEVQISEILRINNVRNISQYIFTDCRYVRPLEFDHYLPNYNTCIEFQGIQHYEPVDFAGKGIEWAEELFKENQMRDQIKRNYCNKNNIKLIEIPYWDIDRIEEILIKELSL